MCQQIWKTQQWPQDCKRSVFISVPKKGNAKECSNYHTIVLISHARKVTLRILQDRLQQHVIGFRKGRGTRDQIVNIRWMIEKTRELQKNIYFIQLYWLCQSLSLCGSKQTEKFFKRWEYQGTWPTCREIYMQVKKQQLELDMEQQTVSKLGKEYIKAVYCHLLI